MSSPFAAYGAVLRAPKVGRTFGSALFGRMAYGILPLSLLLALVGGDRSYGVAGGIDALFGVTVAFLAPLRARLIDRYGPRRTLPLLALPFGGMLAVIGTAATYNVPVPLLGLLAAVGGAFAPPLGPVMRVVWRDLVSGEEQLRRAYSIDTVAEELLFVAGPLVAGGIAALLSPLAALLAAAVLVAAGTLSFVAALPQGTGRVSSGSLRRPGIELAQPVVAALGIGLLLGAVGVLAVAFARSHGESAGAAWCSAALSVGSALGGMVYGVVPWRIPDRSRLVVLVAMPAAVFGLAGLAPGLLPLALIIGVAGLCVSPALATAYLVATESAPPQARVQAGTWVNTAVNTGSTLGTAGVGLALGGLPVAGCFAATGIVVFVLAVVNRGRRPHRSADMSSASRSE